jgi:hypothetical protein
MFSEARLDLAAPKNNSPGAMAGMNTSDASSRLDITASSPFSKAMIMFVSRGNPPLANFHPLAFLFDRLHHLLGRKRVE